MQSICVFTQKKINKLEHLLHVTQNTNADWHRFFGVFIQIQY